MAHVVIFQCKQWEFFWLVCMWLWCLSTMLFIVPFLWSIFGSLGFIDRGSERLSTNYCMRMAWILRANYVYTGAKVCSCVGFIFYRLFIKSGSRWLGSLFLSLPSDSRYFAICRAVCLCLFALSTLWTIITSSMLLYNSSPHENNARVTIKVLLVFLHHQVYYTSLDATRVR